MGSTARCLSTGRGVEKHTGGWGPVEARRGWHARGELMTIGFNGGSRSMQDRFDTRALSDRIDALLVSRHHQ